MGKHVNIHSGIPTPDKKTTKYSIEEKIMQEIRTQLVLL